MPPGLYIIPGSDKVFVPWYDPGKEKYFQLQHRPRYPLPADIETGTCPGQQNRHCPQNRYNLRRPSRSRNFWPHQDRHFPYAES